MQQGDKIDFDFARDDEQARGGSNNEKEHPRAWHHMFSSEREHGCFVADEGNEAERCCGIKFG